MLLLLVARLAVLARRMGIPYPILMVVGGLALASSPGCRRSSSPQTVFLLFLPPILFAAAYFLSLRELCANVRPDRLLAVGLVLATTGAVAGGACAGSQLGWPAAFVLGAIVSPPDAMAATAIAQRLGLPRRLVASSKGRAWSTTRRRWRPVASPCPAVVSSALPASAAPPSAFVAVRRCSGRPRGRMGAVWLRSRLNDPPVEVLLACSARSSLDPSREDRRLGSARRCHRRDLLGARAPRVMSSDTRVLAARRGRWSSSSSTGWRSSSSGFSCRQVAVDIEGYRGRAGRAGRP